MTTARAVSTSPTAPNASTSRSTAPGAAGRFASTFAAALGMPAIAEMSLAVPAHAAPADAQSPHDRATPAASDARAADATRDPANSPESPADNDAQAPEAAADTEAPANEPADQSANHSADQPTDARRQSVAEPRPADLATGDPLAATPTIDPLVAATAASAQADPALVSAEVAASERPSAHRRADTAAGAPANDPAASAQTQAQPAPEVPTDPLGLIRHDSNQPNSSPHPSFSDSRPDGHSADLFNSEANSTTPTDTEPSRATLNARAAASAHANAPVTSTPTTAVAAGIAAAAPAPTTASGPAKGTQDLLGMLGTAARPNVFGVSTKPVRTTAAQAPGSASASVEAQIARGLAAALRQKGGLLTLRLNPEHLGPVRIEVRVDPEGVTAKLDAQNPQTRQKLLADLDSLRRSIEERGLKIHRVEVVGAPDAARPDAPRQPDHAHDHTDHHTQQQWGGSSSGGFSARDDRGSDDKHWNQARWQPADHDAHHWTPSTDDSLDDPAHDLLMLRLDTVA